MTRTIAIKRAPALTLWAAVAAERLGFDWRENGVRPRLFSRFPLRPSGL